MSANGAFARMTVCSKGLHGDVTRSLRVSDFPQIMEKAGQHDIWFNRDLLPLFPSYCAPVYNEEQLIALVMIWRAGVEQMTLHYSNLFQILSGLIQESLVRAVKFNQLRESTIYYQDTRILMKEPFKDAYKANMALAEQEKAEFCLLTAARDSADMASQNSRLESCIRESDIVGTINDKIFGIILKNVTDDDIDTLLDRFSARKLKAKQVSVSEMNEMVLKEAG